MGVDIIHMEESEVQSAFPLLLLLCEVFTAPLFPLVEVHGAPLLLLTSQSPPFTPPNQEGEMKEEEHGELRCRGCGDKFRTGGQVNLHIVVKHSCYLWLDLQD